MSTMRSALALGAVVSLVCFALVFWAVTGLLALILRLEASPWHEIVFSMITVLGVSAGSLMILRHRRGGSRVTHR